MDEREIATITALEERHWWYVARRRLLARHLPGPNGMAIALDLGSAGGGNSMVLSARGWSPIAIDSSRTGTTVARDRGVQTVRGDVERLAVRDGSADLVVAFDILEHLDDDHAAVAEIGRTLRCGGTLLVAVPADPSLWSAHDEAVGHRRRYTRAVLHDLFVAGGLVVDDLWSWNVLLSPLVRRWRRWDTGGSNLRRLPKPINAALLTIITIESRITPLRRGAGVTLVLRGHKP